MVERAQHNSSGLIPSWTERSGHDDISKPFRIRKEGINAESIDSETAEPVPPLKTNAAFQIVGDSIRKR